MFISNWMKILQCEKLYAKKDGSNVKFASYKSNKKSPDLIQFSSFHPTLISPTQVC